MLAGRDAERAAVAALLDGARGGTGGALVVRGVAGAGKSTLLADAAAAAAGVRVLRTSGVESESPLAFAALQRLLWPLRSLLPGLPAPQRAALGAALGVAAGEGDRFLVFLGTLSLLADAAEDCPVLVVVDDAHWLDDASAAALLFVARRLGAERVALLFAARDGDARRLDAADLPAVVLGALTGADADAVLSARAGVVADPAVRDRLVTATGGNPLALGELAGVLTGDQLAGRAPLPDPLPLTGGVERAFLDRYRRLAEPAQRLLLVAAADDTGRTTVVRDAAGLLDAGDDALDAVERSGLLRVDGDAVHLDHPLVRSAVYRAATSARRRAAHRALADVLAGDPDRRAWHLAAAADRPDATVVTALDEVAERAAARGGHEAASAAWARAAELTTAGADRGRRLHLAASSAWLGAHPSRAAALAAAAAAEVTEPLPRARLLLLQAQVEWNTHSLNDGYDLVLQAARLAAGVDEATARPLAMLAAALSAFGARSPDPLDPATLVGEPDAGAPPAARVAWALLQGFAAVGRRDWATAARSFRRGFDLTDADPLAADHVLHPNLGLAAWLVDDDPRSLRLHDEQLTAARRAGALPMVEHALTRGFHAQLATGAWTQAAGAAAEALPLTASTGATGLTALPLAQLALVAALRGDDAADRHLAEVGRIREEHPVGITDSLVTDLAHWARALRSAGQPASAVHHLERLQNPVLRRLATLDLFDAAARAGREDVVRSWLAEVEQFAGATGTASAVAVTEHGRALLADGPAADEHFRAALEAHAASPRTPDRARTQLAYGEHLRRARRRVDAREHLRAALTAFEDLGAAPLAERAAQELRASGETARRRDVSTATDLTAQERQVAGLVRQGLSNRDVAARLFVSPRTVDFHLRNVFAKLGVTSRAELTALPLDRPPAARPAVPGDRPGGSPGVTPAARS
ncbi:regulatory protein, luxR family [Geodermatophilus telluris]|uniref:Regulatory protein, luxR family n=1 Tax=Geodermatophilus telluris TaxID=1190417 RepID=A0A1G6IIH8_9ACTN|nr:helix-turn-helix transcriptional regulator [Geodermatophilus telluris]SDC06329.1 regulatory protein, luxR family [Geodermatophilus telluris]